MIMIIPSHTHVSKYKDFNLLLKIRLDLIILKTNKIYIVFSNAISMLVLIFFTFGCAVDC